MAHLTWFLIGWLIALLVAPTDGSSLRREALGQIGNWLADLRDLSRP